MEKKKKHIAFWIIFPIVYILLSLIILFYFDLANGPLSLFIIELLVLVGLCILRIMFIGSKFWKRLLIWLGFFSLTAGIVFFYHPSEVTKSAAYHKNPIQIEQDLELVQGKVKGIYNKDQDVEIYAGIPYATAERWKLPQEYVWEGVRDGSKFGPTSMQPSKNPVMDTLVEIYAEKSWHPDYKMYPLQDRSEDALLLNIWKPKTTETNLPILVYIHGGSLTNGSAAFDDYNGENLAKKGIIMITIQYRLGVFGYFAHPDLMTESYEESNHEYQTTGNYGLLDQIEALKWINKNAERIGGDKNNITIAGESAGSSSVSALCTSPLAKNLFKRAIGESSSLVLSTPPHTFRSLDSAYETSSKILEEFNCSSIEELRQIDPYKLVETKYSNSSMCVDGYALSKTPYEVYLEGSNNEEALLNGYNVLEADAFVVPTFLFEPTNKDNIQERLTAYFDEETANKMMTLYHDKIEQDAFSAFNEIISVYWFINPHHSWSNMALNNNEDVYRYQFTKENGYYGTYHSGEMIYAYNNISKSNHQFAYNEKDQNLADIMSSYWVNFVRTGNPNGEGLPLWNKYTSSTDKVMELGENVGMINDAYLELYNIINEYITK